MTLAEECRRMVELLPGIPSVADLLRRAAGGLESVQVEADEVVNRAFFDRGADAMQEAIRQRLVTLWEIRQRFVPLCDLEGRP